MKDKMLSLKPGPVVVLKKILIIEVLLAIIIGIFTFVFDYITLFGQLNLPETLSSTVFAMILLGAAQMLSLIGIFLSWSFESYEIYKDKLVHKRGVFFKSNEIRPFEKLTSIRRKEGILGKWLNYASIVLEDAKAAQIIIIPDVYKPEDEIKEIERITSFTSGNVNSDNSQLKELLKMGEGKNLEFKASFRWDLNKGAANKDIEYTIVRSISAFMNTEGGKLVIGVNDEGNVVGLENDIKSIKKQNLDGLENHFTTVFSNLVGTSFTQNYEMSFEKCEGLDVCIVDVQRSSEPVFVKINDEEKLYVRAGNSTRELSIKEAIKYILSNYEDYR